MLAWAEGAVYWLAKFLCYLMVGIVGVPLIDVSFRAFGLETRDAIAASYTLVGVVGIMPVFFHRKPWEKM